MRFVQQLKYLKKAFSDLPNKISIWEAIRQGMIEEMHRDQNVFLMGEEVGQYQGAYKVSKGMLETFGAERVIDTPITENGFTGLAIGASYYGTRPILEYMTWNFALQAMSHIYNSAAKTFYMSGGDFNVPIVFWGLNGPAASVAAQHSQCLAQSLANVPGLIVVAPYDAYDCKGLIKSAIWNDNPVCYLENELMYSVEFKIEKDFWNEDFLVPIGKAKVQREGTDCTVVAFSWMVGVALEAAEILQRDFNISLEVINLRTIKPMDTQTIQKSVIKTHWLVTVEDGYPVCGIGAEIVANIMESEAFDYLDAWIERVTAWDVPLPYAKNLERETLPQVENIIKAVRNTLIGVK